MTGSLGPDPATVVRDGAALVLTREAMRWAVPTAVVLVVGSFVLRGTAGGVTALLVAAVLLAVQYVSGWVVGRASQHGPNAVQAATMFGLLARLVLYGALVVTLADVEAIDVPVLAVVVCTLTVVLLAAETRMASRYSRLWWSPEPATGDASSASPRPVPLAPAGAEQKDRP